MATVTSEALTEEALIAVPRVVFVAVTSSNVGRVTAVGVFAVHAKLKTPLVTLADQEAAVPAVLLPLVFR